MGNGASPVRLNVGGGAVRIDGWLNVDLRRDVSDVVADAGNLPFHDGAAQEILASDILEHFPLTMSYRLLAEWRRVLQPGGRLTLKVPNLSALAEAILLHESEQAIMNVYGGHRWGPEGAWDTHHTGWTPRTLEQLLRHAGFEVESNDGAPNMTVRALSSTARPEVIRKGQDRDVSVGILAGDDVVRLYHCINALAANPPCEEFQTVLFDPETNPAVSGLIASLDGDIVLVRGGSLSGPAQIANALISASSGDIMMFLSDEVEVTPGWGAPLIAALRSDSGVGLAIPAFTDPFTPSGWSIGATVVTCPIDEMLMAVHLDGRSIPLTVEERLVVPSGAVAFRRDCLESAGGMDGGYTRTMHWPAVAAEARERGWRTALVAQSRLEFKGMNLTVEELCGTYVDRSRFTQIWGQRLRESDTGAILIGAAGTAA